METITLRKARRINRKAPGVDSGLTGFEFGPDHAQLSADLA